jgi:hypothetical protein
MSHTEEWIEKYSKTHQRKYYFNTKTKESRWENPKILVSVSAEKTDSKKEPQTEKVSFKEVKDVIVEEKVTFFDFLMECLRNEVNNEYVWDRRFDPNFVPSMFPYKVIMPCEKNKKDFGFYWISKLPYVVREIDIHLGVVSIISLFEKTPSIFETFPKDVLLRSKLGGFKPSYEFNLAAFAAFIGIQTKTCTPWREMIWNSDYKSRFEKNVVWDVTPENWNMISKVRVTLCVSYASKASLCFTREMQAFVQMISQIR